MRRKLLVFSPLYPPSTGGLQNHAEQWNREMVKLGYRVTVLTPHVAGGSAQETTPDGIDINRFPAFELIPNWPVPKFWYFEFWHLLNMVSHDADIFISRTRFFSTSLLARHAAKKFTVPWLHIEHGSDYVQLNNPTLQFLAKLYDHSFGWLVLRSATKIVANSNASAHFVNKLAGRDAQVIYRGVDVEKIESIAPAPKEEAITITYAGRLIDGKGVADLLLACQQLKTNAPTGEPNDKFQLLIIGSGPQRFNLEQQAQRLNIWSQVKFLGEKTWSETIAILKSSDIFVNPSYTEGLPSSVIEAVLCGCRVVATNVGGTREIFGITLVPPRQSGRLVEAIKQAFTDMPPDAADTVRQQFSWQASAEHYQNLLETMV